MESNFSLADMAAACGNGNCGNNQWNNPMWLIWAILFGRNGGFFGNGDATAQGVDINNRLNALSGQIADNQNTNTLNAGIMGNHDFLHGFQNAMNMGFAGTNAAINQASMTNALGQKDAQAQMSSCCCDIKTNILNQTNQLQSAINGVQNSLINGFAQVGFLTQQQTNELNQNTNAGIQRILDKMCSDETQSLRDKLAEASQNAQTNYLISQLKTT